MNAQSEMSCPDVVLASIAWYPDRLDEERRGLVESHAAECSACREELAFVQGETELELSLPDSAAAYEKVLARIERSEASVRSGASELANPLGAPARRRSVFGARPAALAAGIALALLIGGLGVVGGLRLGDPSAQSFFTASGAASPGVAASAPTLNVVFRDEASAESIHAALRAIDGQIVAGPTPLGVFQVKLVPTADMAAAARVLQGDGQGVATFAQPAGG